MCMYGKVRYPICLHGNVAITFNTPAIYYFYCVRIDAKWLLPNVFSFVYICIYLQKSKHKRLSPPACLFDSLWQCYGANKRCVTNESRTKLIVLAGIHLRISCVLVLAKQRQRRANHICGISHVLFFTNTHATHLNYSWKIADAFVLFHQIRCGFVS